ncbi:MAG: AGE family epimerase/isomerase [Oscillospiraceae bacterium]|nr:AGE family epimerase/isomerase [Oscillospiraceae bacterium]
MKNEIINHLNEHIIPFWDSLVDRENGGFYGYVGNDLKPDKTADKGAVLHLRILWFYSNCYLILGDEKHLKTAKHCYDFIVKHFWDKEWGGVFTNVTATGKSLSPYEKSGYSYAFFIYAMSSYYAASGDSAAFELVLELFRKVEVKGYYETYAQNWCSRSENKTAGYILHLVESYTEFYRVTESLSLKAHIAKCTEEILRIIYDKIYNKDEGCLYEVFDENMNVVGDKRMYGHYVEAAWLIGRTLDTFGDLFDLDLTAKIRVMNESLYKKADEVAFSTGGALYYEEVGGVVNKRRAWWPQAEGVVGFLDAFRRTGEQKYFERAEGLWGYIKSHVIDKREGGEWFNELDENENPVTETFDEKKGKMVELPIVGDWKCPYHNGRMCLMAMEVLE